MSCDPSWELDQDSFPSASPHLERQRIIVKSRWIKFTQVATVATGKEPQKQVLINMGVHKTLGL